MANSTLSNTTITGNTTGNGNGVSISGNITNGTITGNTTGNGNGVNISGNITNGTITGNAVSGNGVEVTGPSVLNNTTLSGSSVSGEDLKLSAPLLQKGNSPQAAAQRQHQQNQAVLGALSDGDEGVTTSGYRPATRKLTISVCDEEKNCTRRTLQTEHSSDVQQPHRHTG
nr:adhesin [Escherichia coli]